MKRRIVVALLVAVVAVTWWYAARSMDYETPVELPESSNAEYVSGDDWIDVHITKDGEVLFGNTPVTLDELEARMAKEPEERPILLCADARVPFIHFSWVCGSLPDRVWLGVRSGSRRLAFDANRGDFNAEPYYFVNLFPDDETGQVVFRPGLDMLQEAAAAGEHVELAFMSIDIRVPHAALLACLDDLRGAGVAWQRWPQVRAHASVRELRRLPEPSRAQLVRVFGMPTLELPVIPGSVEDTRDDERLTISMDDQGSTPFRGIPRSLDEFGTIVSEAKRVANLRARVYDKTCAPPHRDKLSVVLRVSREAPWLHVKWLLGVLADEDVDRVQLASRYRQFPFDPGRELDGRFDLARPARATNPVRIRVEAHGTAERAWGPHTVEMPAFVTYSVDGRSTGDIDEFSKWLKVLAKEHDLVHVDGDSRVPYRYVAAAAGHARTAGFGEIDLAAANAHWQRRWDYLPYPGTELPASGDPPDRIEEPEEEEDDR